MRGVKYLDGSVHQLQVITDVFSAINVRSDIMRKYRLEAGKYPWENNTCMQYVSEITEWLKLIKVEGFYSALIFQIFYVIINKVMTLLDINL